MQFLNADCIYNIYLIIFFTYFLNKNVLFWYISNPYTHTKGPVYKLNFREK